MRMPIYKFACLTLLHTIVAIGCYVATTGCSLALPPGMEPERISHYDPEAVPKGVPNDLPPITDPDGMRDTFFYPDGIGKGRVVHMRFPKNFVSSNFGEILPRHSDYLVFIVVYPELISIATPNIWKEIYKHGGHIPDSEIDVGITRPSRDYLANEAERFLASVEAAEKKYPRVRFESISVPDGFATPKCNNCRLKGLRKIITYRDDAGLNFPNNQEVVDTYIEWGTKVNVTRFMQCMHTPRPDCSIDIQSGSGNKFYNLSIDFHGRYLSKLPDVIDRVSEFINSSVVEIN